MMRDLELGKCKDAPQQENNPQYGEIDKLLYNITIAVNSNIDSINLLGLVLNKVVGNSFNSELVEKLEIKDWGYTLQELSKIMDKLVEVSEVMSNSTSNFEGIFGALKVKPVEVS